MTATAGTATTLTAPSPSIVWETEPMDFIDDATIHVASNGVKVTFADGSAKYWKKGPAALRAGNVRMQMGGKLDLTNSGNAPTIAAIAVGRADKCTICM